MNKKFIAKRNYVLRKVLNSENNLDILQNFIEAVLNIKIEKIILNPYLKEKARYLPSEENFGIADARIISNTKEELNIGIQIIDGIYIQTKLLMYYCQIHTNQIKYEDNRKIAKTKTINILDFNYYSSFCYHKKIYITNPTKISSEEDIELHILELEKFQPMFLEKMTPEEQWLTYIKGSSYEECEKVKKQNFKIKKLDRLLDLYWKNEKII